jgi:hypothetical protein
LFDLVEVTDNNVVASITPQARELTYNGAYILCSLVDEEIPDKKIAITLTKGKLEPKITFQKPDETFSFRLVTEQPVGNTNQITVHSGAIDGKHINMATVGFRFTIPTPQKSQKQ